MWSVVIDIMKMNYDAEKLKGVEMKKIIDVCCGGRMFWFDKQNPNVEFCDNRKFKTTLCDGREFEVNPDTVCGNEVTQDFEEGPDFQECQETIKSFGWISRKINGKWYDFCCHACYKKFEAKQRSNK